MLEYENSRNPFPVRERWVRRCLRFADSRQRVDENIRERAEELEREGLKALDALHVACAEAAGSECFLTCDSQLIRRYQGEVKVLNPVDFVLSVWGG